MTLRLRVEDHGIGMVLVRKGNLFDGQAEAFMWGGDLIDGRVITLVRGGDWIDGVVGTLAFVLTLVVVCL